MHYEIWFETLDLIREWTPVAIINWGTDNSWKFRQFSRFLCRHVDLHVTTDVNALTAAAKLGITNIVGSQWAASSTGLAEPLPSSACSYDVSFVGMAYGNRRAHIDALARKRNRGRLFRARLAPRRGRSQSSSTNLSLVEDHTQFRGFRSAPVRWLAASQPSGESAYVRSTRCGWIPSDRRSQELGKYFSVGDEMITYVNDNDLAETIQFFLSRPEERDRIARAGFERVKREHLYERRFSPIIDRALNLAVKRRNRPWKIHTDMLRHSVERHRRGATLRRVLGRLKGALGDPHRLWRALRRLTYELSWRARGERTFSAGGLPGRFFYRES